MSGAILNFVLAHPNEAADRIEALEAALERIETLCSEMDIINVLSTIARAALDKDARK